jgi:hypothetical protein
LGVDLGPFNPLKMPDCTSARPFAHVILSAGHSPAWLHDFGRWAPRFWASHGWPCALRVIITAERCDLPCGAARFVHRISPFVAFPHVRGVFPDEFRRLSFSGALSDFRVFLRPHHGEFSTCWPEGQRSSVGPSTTNSPNPYRGPCADPCPRQSLPKEGRHQSGRSLPWLSSCQPRQPRRPRRPAVVLSRPSWLSRPPYSTTATRVRFTALGCRGCWRCRAQAFQRLCLPDALNLTRTAPGWDSGKHI